MHTSERHCPCISLHYNIEKKKKRISVFFRGGVSLKAVTSEVPQEPRITTLLKESFWLQDSEEMAGGSNLKALLLKFNECSGLPQS